MNTEPKSTIFDKIFSINSSTTFFKQYGLERSGTNYIKALLDINFQNTRVLSNIYGFKHGDFQPFDAGYNPALDRNVVTDLKTNELEFVKESFRTNQIKYLVSTKLPHSWATSYSKCPWIRGTNSLSVENVTSYIDKWNKQNRNWIEYILEKESLSSVLIRYEDLVVDPQKVINMISMKYAIDIKEAFNILEFRRMRTGPDVNGFKNITNHRFDKSYYTEERYMNELPEEIKELIDKLVDKDVLAYIASWKHGEPG